MFCRHSLFMLELIRHFLNLLLLRNLRKQMTQLTVLDTILRIITHLSQHAGCAPVFLFVYELCKLINVSQNIAHVIFK
jgi:hypothetical protein